MAIFIYILMVTSILCKDQSSCPSKCTCNNLGRVACKGLESIPKDLPANTKSFRSLEGHIESIDSKDFEYLPHLEFIIMDKVKSINLKSFMPKLILLWISNYQGDVFNSEDYIGAVNLEQIQYDKSNIRKISITQGLQKLKWLQLSNSSITSLDLSAFKTLKDLAILMFASSEVKHLSVTSEIGPLRYLDLEKNHIMCDCDTLKKLSQIEVVVGSCLNRNSKIVSFARLNYEQVGCP